MTASSRGLGARPLLVILLVVLLKGSALARSLGPWQGRFAVGGEISATSFGIIDLGLRKGPLSIQVLTDTLDLRWAPEVTRGRYFVGLRVQTFAAGLMFSPWRDGAPDPSRAWNAAYVGADGGYVRYLSGGWYAGVQGSARLYLFWARESTTVPPPGPTPLFTAELLLGHYTKDSHISLRAGADAELAIASPHVIVEAVVRPDWAFAPHVEARAAWAMNQDVLMRTRLGGLNPYVVPLAGAAWAEFWVESYVALRAGPSIRARLPGRGAHTLQLTAVGDVAGTEGSLLAGFGLLTRWRYRRLFVDASLGYAPWIKRQEGVARTAGFLLVGADWGSFWKLD